MSMKEYREGMSYGVGLDSLDGSLRGDEVIRKDAEEVVGASGQTVQFHIERLDTVEDLQQSMSIGAEVDVSYGPFASGSARCDFAESCSIHHYSVFLLVRTEVSNSFRQMRDVALKPQAIELLHNGSDGPLPRAVRRRVRARPRDRWPVLRRARADRDQRAPAAGHQGAGRSQRWAWLDGRIRVNSVNR